MRSRSLSFLFGAALAAAPALAAPAPTDVPAPEETTPDTGTPAPPEVAAPVTVYRWVDEAGVTHFSDSEPEGASGATRIEVPRIKSVAPGTEASQDHRAAAALAEQLAAERRAREAERRAERAERRANRAEAEADAARTQPSQPGYVPVYPARPYGAVPRHPGDRHRGRPPHPPGDRDHDRHPPPAKHEPGGRIPPQR